MLLERIGIKNLKEIADRWHWDVVTVDFEGDERINHYNTNNRGEGVYSQSSQIAGNCQFSLSGVSRSTMYRRIRDFFTV